MNSLSDKKQRQSSLSDTGSNNYVSPEAKKIRFSDFASCLANSHSIDCISSNEVELMSEPSTVNGVAKYGLDEHKQERRRVPPLIRRKQPTAKIFTDSIHGTIELPAVLVALIDTPQFARLRKLKQVGSCHFVYPNASHTRFEHSLGVAHLAGVYVRELQSRYPNFISNKDILCVMMAGLCHDLGHGPYSHLWEVFVNEARQRNICKSKISTNDGTFSSDTTKYSSPYKHESNSVAMFDHMLEENGHIKLLLKDVFGIDETDLIFIKEQIGGPPNVSETSNTWPYKGRGPEKAFLYEIVANKLTGIDVDKWDYFLRDDYYMKIGRRFDYQRFIKFCRIEKIQTAFKDTNGVMVYRKQIIMRDKELENLKKMVEDRAELHIHGYQHRVTKIIDRMLLDAWLEADKCLTIGSSPPLSLSQSVESIEAHQSLYDAKVNVLIEDSSDDKLSKARALLSRIESRDLYQVVQTVDLIYEGKCCTTAAASSSSTAIRSSNHGCCKFCDMSEREILDDIRSHVLASPSSVVEVPGDMNNRTVDANGEDAIKLVSDSIGVMVRNVSTGLETDKLYVYKKNEEICENIEHVSIGAFLDTVRQKKLFILCKDVLLKTEIECIVRSWMNANHLMC